MRAVVQRIAKGKISVGNEVVASCEAGLLVLVAAHRDDTEQKAAKMADRVAGLRIFNDANGKLNLALSDLPNQGTVLAVSNFTLYGETSKNRRPSFIESAPYEIGLELFTVFCNALRGLGCRVESGEFGSHMMVEIVNDGPVTLVLDT